MQSYIALQDDNNVLADQWQAYTHTVLNAAATTLNTSTCYSQGFTFAINDDEKKKAIASVLVERAQYSVSENLQQQQEQQSTPLDAQVQQVFSQMVSNKHCALAIVVLQKKQSNDETAVIPSATTTSAVASDHNYKPQQKVAALILCKQFNIIPIHDASQILNEALKQLAVILHRPVQIMKNEGPFKPNFQQYIPEFINTVSFVSKFTLFGTFFSQHDGLVAVKRHLDESKQQFGIFMTPSTLNNNATIDEKQLLVLHGRSHNAMFAAVNDFNVEVPQYASLVSSVFAVRGDVNTIVYTPVDKFPNAKKIQSFATVEELEREVVKVAASFPLVQLIGLGNYHGTLILLQGHNAESIEQELANLLLQNSVYGTSLAWYYDVSYARFQFNPKLRDLLLNSIQSRKDAHILDMCGGTGIFMRELLDLGYTNVHIADVSEHMLKCAKDKAKPYPFMSTGMNRFHTVSMEQFDSEFGAGKNCEQLFDAIVIRQAINYIKPNDLVATFKKFKNALVPGSGYFMFNSFLYTKQAAAAVRTTRFDTGRYIVRTSEQTLVMDQKDQKQQQHHPSNPYAGHHHYHSQQSFIFDMQTGEFSDVYDLNKFYIYSAEEYVVAAKEAGFTAVTLETMKTSCYIICKH